VNKTTIEWVKNLDGTQGYTWNPITGCLNHRPEGLCLGGMFPYYAYKLANGRLKSRYLANKNVAPFPDFIRGRDCLINPFYPRFWEDRMWLPELVGGKKKPKGIFVCDVSDLFGIGVPEEWTRRVLDVIRKHPRHRFYLLTKQPQNLIKFRPFPDNCWVGVSATNQEMWNDALGYLTDIKATVKYISIEPHLGQIIPDTYTMRKAQLGWIIDGSQTKPYKPPKIDWVKEIVEAADRAGVKMFLKNNLLELVNYDSPETEFAFNKEGYYRQEMPNLEVDR